ncbi:hypothetical protein IFM89_031830 [Coptis chinensis]|uniref:Agenet domain-containing protein n=1 Tax=Coptis chinensis TaxID=261450 RepID=A0A835H106_9MAGN|nr:hypothetical protein IFM89_031830 [Coptis chinensis]
MRFRKGDTVEVSIKEEGFHDSYYVATVLSSLEDDQYLVEFKTLLDDDDETKPCTDIVHGVNVRPLPPDITVSSFSLNEKVDVYDNDGWWVGMVGGLEGVDVLCVF